MVSETGSGETEAINARNQCCRLASCHWQSDRGAARRGTSRPVVGSASRCNRSGLTRAQGGVGGQWCAAGGKLRQPYQLNQPVSNAAPTSYAKHYATAESEKKLPSFFFNFSPPVWSLQRIKISWFGLIWFLKTEQQVVLFLTLWQRAEEGAGETYLRTYQRSSGSHSIFPFTYIC